MLYVIIPQDVCLGDLKPLSGAREGKEEQIGNLGTKCFDSVMVNCSCWKEEEEEEKITKGSGWG